MIFSSVQYLIFLPVVVFIYWRLKGRPRLLFTVAASYFFYMSWMPVYGVLLALLSTVNWLLARSIEDVNGKRGKGNLPAKLLLLSGLFLNVGALCYYKYANFFFENLSLLVHAVAPVVPVFSAQLASYQAPLMAVFLPLGISFFVFEFVHYLTDVYKGDKSVKSLFEFAAFAVFFPSQIAGPIKRYQDFLAQLRQPLVLDSALMAEGTTLFMQGLFKKAAMADPIGALILKPYDMTQMLSGPDAWIAVIGFTIQIYCDFSGYTDMGRGSALLLGIRLPINFNLPLLCGDISVFWRRWHISLSTWLKDYVYIALGGSRYGEWLQARNLFITMAISGLWHGASWHFVLWGALHGVAMIVHHQWCRLLEAAPLLKRAAASTVGNGAAIIITQLFVALAFALFRAPDIPHAFNMWASLLNFGGEATLVEPLLKSGCLVIAGGYLAFWILIEYLRRHQTMFDGLLKGPDQSFLPQVRLATYTMAIILAVASKPLEAVPFLYFQF